MFDKELIETFYDQYTNKQETMYRLPMSVDIEDFWPEELERREREAIILPLHSFDGEPYYYNRTDRFLKAADEITAMARTNPALNVITEIGKESMIDEAFYSSSIEGAFSTKEDAHRLIESGKEPKSKDGRMIANNYSALQFVIEHLDDQVDDDLIIKIADILTEGTLDGGPIKEYRNDAVYVVSRRGKIEYTAPEAKSVKPMMGELCAYLNDPMIHPVEKAVIAHIYFVIVHPFFDGNGRTARALTYMVLLKAGYDFFRLIPISGILSENRSRYYKAIRSSQDPANGHDLTYFSDHYSKVLADTLKATERRIDIMEKLRSVEGILDPPFDARLLKGARWMAAEDIPTITAAKWQKKFGVSFETARKDLIELEQLGFLTRRKQGHKVFFYL